MTKYVSITLLVIVLTALAVLGVRGTTSRKPPIYVFDDMDDQPKYKSQAESAFYADGRSMRMPPNGTIPWGRRAVQPAAELAADDPANFELKSIPVKVDRALLARGRKVFDTYCAVCHGPGGAGNGVTASYNIAPPASYHTDRLRDMTDGYLYQVITEGKGLMGAYGPSVRPTDRWAAVAWVRVLQRAHNATMEDVPEAQREELRKTE